MNFRAPMRGLVPGLLATALAARAPLAQQPETVKSEPFEAALAEAQDGLSWPALVDPRGRPSDEAEAPARLQVETQVLARLTSNHDDEEFLLRARVEPGGRLSALDYVDARDLASPKVFGLDGEMGRCDSGAHPLMGCGAQVREALLGYSAVRLHGPELDRERGGAVMLLHLYNGMTMSYRHYRLELGREAGRWRLYAFDGSARRPIAGLFVRRWSLGIDRFEPRF